MQKSTTQDILACLAALQGKYVPWTIVLAYLQKQLDKKLQQNLLHAPIYHSVPFMVLTSHAPLTFSPFFQDTST